VVHARLAIVLAGILPGLAGPTAARAAAAEYDPAPTSPIPAGWAELDLHVDAPGAAVAVDTGHFCGLPCRILLSPGAHNLRLVAPDLEPRDFTRTLDAGSSLSFAGPLVREEWDGWGIALYVLGAAALLTSIGLVASDVATNVGEARDDWTASYAAAGLGPAGLILAIWGAVRGAGSETPLDPLESVSR
jgi:hypothetical protein